MTEDEIVAAIESLCRPERFEGRHRILLGIGDDAAVWQPSRSHRSVISTDMLVEGVHFTRELMTLEDAGWRATAANLSDLAAMGAKPVLATVALGVPANRAQAEILEIYRGIAACARQYGIAIAGGDLSRSEAIAIAITVVGEVRPSNLKTRAGGRPGDVLAVTGPLGAARAGLSGEEAGLAALRRPEPRIAEGRFLAASRNVDAMIDCSDGLSTDLSRLCAASGCGAVVEAVPVAPAARDAAVRRGEDPENLALAGGEDFELIVAIRPRAFSHLATRYAKHFKRELLRVGVLSKEAGLIWRGSPLTSTGWDHFARTRIARALNQPETEH
ncbi:MAG TPA: thiamine-phosphate kinase [Candidatus Cybelea sp.]|nr:thiamine-phosphate kinase [Candidatus Cybelea sp.]